MARHFAHLRKRDWAPGFHWVKTVDEAAYAINLPHEDFPFRVEATVFAVENQFLRPTTKGWMPIDNERLLRIHQRVFADQTFAGRWRDVRVGIGGHIAPGPERVPQLMEELELHHWLGMRDVEALKEWYFDLETIHPFQDGNGRVGGIILASYSHVWDPEKGYLVPEQ